jgi:hypothetical protein
MGFLIVGKTTNRDLPKAKSFFFLLFLYIQYKGLAQKYLTVGFLWMLSHHSFHKIENKHFTQFTRKTFSTHEEKGKKKI